MLKDIFGTLSSYLTMKCRNCDKEFENGKGEFCSDECDEVYYDIHKPGS
ncbi:MAG: hypothetical protein YK1309IOTA_620002 [Marine Group I thaumarchaeote]|nr:MAG: hypothetical protein YK1309IOTA_620002 [Marine Group I thaumarchaeote]